MESTRIRSVALGTLIALGAVACSTSTGGSTASTGSGAFKTGPGVDLAAKSITLGVLTPLSGPAALIGSPLTNGQKAYFDSLNANGGINGWKVNLTVQDTKYDPQTQVQEYNQLAPGVLFLGQSLGSPTTQAIESLASSAGILVGTAAQDSAFVNQKINAVIGTPYAVDTANAMFYVSQHKPAAKLGIIYQNDAYGTDGLKGFTAGVAAYNLNKVADATYNATDTAFTSQVLAMKNAGADTVVLTALPTPAATMVGTAASMGYHPQWIFQGPAWSEFLMSSTGDPTGKATAVAPALVGVWILDYEAAWGDTSVAGMNQFLAVQKQYFPTQVPDNYFLYGYCLALMEKNLLAKAIAARDLTRAGVLDAKLHLGTIDFGGLLPNATYTPSLGPADRQTGISQVDAGAPGYLKQIEPYFTSSAAQSMTFAG
ncbi:MAG TPA: ABC transporter substrate-binding protein [Acidimicrobiales bacterium]|nr:ABC transporter substrate-binding protein [Acidimicrobiales bacterium]